jgi:hypothetical protein
MKSRLHYHVVRRYADATRDTSPPKRYEDAHRELLRQINIERATGNTAHKITGRPTYEVVASDTTYRLFLAACHDQRCAQPATSAATPSPPAST